MRRDGPRFALLPAGTCAPADSTRKKMVRSLCGSQGSACRRFRDNSSGLNFCMPTQTQMQRLSFSPNEDPMSFEVRMQVQQTGIVLYLRKDKLPDALPRGALAGRWLMRYAESYIRRRGSEMREVRRKILNKRRNQFLKTTSGVWAAFPFVYGGREYWEEVLVLAREPGVRYLISIRISEDLRRAKPQDLRQFLLLFLHQLRMAQKP